jgi:peptidoglycan hydrolase-like protein with peptidoglycan-binding domain
MHVSEPQSTRSVTGASPTSRRSPEVLEAQSLMAELGGALRGTGRSGVLDDGTQKALAIFQEGHGLEVTGTPTPETVARLRVEVGRQRAREGVELDDAPRVPRTSSARPDAFASGLQERLLAMVPRKDGLQAKDGAESSTPAGGSVDVDGAITRLVARSIPPADLAAFELVERANEGAETGGREVWSSLRTTAGVPAAFGTGQLNVTEHLAELRNADAAFLTELGFTQDEVRALYDRAVATEAFYQVAVEGEMGRNAPRHAGLSPSEARELATLVRDGDFDEAVSRFGDAFERATTLPRSAMRDMLVTSLVRSPENRQAFLDTYQRVHGEAFNPERRNMPKMIAAMNALVAERPELRALVDLAGVGSAAHYLGRADTRENMKGWAHRAALEGQDADRFRALIEGGSRLTTTQRHVNNFNRARRAVDAAGVTGEGRTRLIARIARQFHGAPGSTRDLLFREDGTPRYTTEAALRGALERELASNARRRGSDDRFSPFFDHVAREAAQ